MTMLDSIPTYRDMVKQCQEEKNHPPETWATLGSGIQCILVGGDGKGQLFPATRVFDFVGSPDQLLIRCPFLVLRLRNLHARDRAITWSKEAGHLQEVVLSGHCEGFICMQVPPGPDARLHVECEGKVLSLDLRIAPLRLPA